MLDGTYCWPVQLPDDVVVRHYKSIQEEERLFRGPGEIELDRAKDVLRRHLPPPPADVLDVGGATGTHASWLAGDGYRVRLIDISPRHVAKAKADLVGLGVVAELGDARKLAAADASYDVVLVFGGYGAGTMYPPT